MRFKCVTPSLCLYCGEMKRTLCLFRSLLSNRSSMEARSASADAVSHRACTSEMASKSLRSTVLPTLIALIAFFNTPLPWRLIAVSSKVSTYSLSRIASRGYPAEMGGSWFISATRSSEASKRTHMFMTEWNMRVSTIENSSTTTSCGRESFGIL